ncbi:hypothetical protein ACS0TY_031466 [Phlomoides rotata]
MSSPYVKLGDRTLDQWKVTELREELKKRKLITKGLKEDLVKRLDEAIRIEWQSSMENEDNNDSETDSPLEQEKTEPDVSETAKDFVDKEIGIIEKVDAKPEHENDDSRDSLGLDKALEDGLVQGTEAAGVEGKQIAQLSAVEIAVAANETTGPVSEPQLESHGTNEDGDSTVLLNNDEYPQEDAKLDMPDPNTQPPQINDSSMSGAPPSPSNIQGSETQDEAIHPKDPKENDESECPPPDSSVQPPDLGFHVTSDSVSTESLSIEKNELKIDVITDNVQLEQDVKHETTHPSPSIPVPDGGESHPMDVEEPLNKNDVEEPLDKKELQEPVDKKEITEPTGGSDPGNVDSLKSGDIGDMGPPEKLSLDRSSGDDSMEEDILESKQMEYKSDTFTDHVEKSETPFTKEEEHVDVVGHDNETKVKPVEMKVTDAENETNSALTSGKRKFQDKEAAGNNNSVKKVRRWNADGLKNSEPQSGSITPKGLSDKPITGTNSTINVEAPKERLVPPPSRPPSNSLRIDRFLRPFTLKAVQELLGKTGTVTSFWMDHIKTHCYVSYASVEEAVETRNAVYNLQWPLNGGRLLVAEFVDPQEVKSRVEAPLASPPTPPSTTPTFSTSQQQPTAQPQPSPRQQIPLPSLPPPPPLTNPPPLVRERLLPPREQPIPARDRLNLPPPPPLPEKVDPPIVTLDDLFRKTKATPRIYYLPLTDEQVAAKLKTQGKNVNQ